MKNNKSPIAFLLMYKINHKNSNKFYIRSKVIPIELEKKYYTYFVDKRLPTFDEAKKFLINNGLDFTDKEINQFN